MGIARSSAHAQPVDFHQACQPPFTVSYGHNDRSVLLQATGFTVGIAPLGGSVRVTPDED
jgi:hypothetical protein